MNIYRIFSWTNLALIVYGFFKQDVYLIMLNTGLYLIMDTKADLEDLKKFIFNEKKQNENNGR